MTVLAFDTALPQRPLRVLVAGASGSGKTTTAGKIAEALNVPHIEIDGLYHGRDWVPRSAVRADVEGFAAKSAWVTEWQYSSVRPLLLERADLMVWLDLATPTVMAQVVWRTASRRWRRQVLWNGNAESPLWTVLVDRDHIVRLGLAHASQRRRAGACIDTRSSTASGCAPLLSLPDGGLAQPVLALCRASHMTEVDQEPSSAGTLMSVC